MTTLENLQVFLRKRELIYSFPAYFLLSFRPSFLLSYLPFFLSPFLFFFIPFLLPFFFPSFPSLKFSMIKDGLLPHSRRESNPRGQFSNISSSHQLQLKVTTVPIFFFRIQIRGSGFKSLCHFNFSAYSKHLITIKIKAKKCILHNFI